MKAIKFSSTEAKTKEALGDYRGAVGWWLACACAAGTERSKNRYRDLAQTAESKALAIGT